jgi:hypothetical protein
MSEDQHDHPGHGDATLDVIALLEATLNDDDQGMDAMLEGVLSSEHLSHVLGEFTGILAAELAGQYGREGALKFLAHMRGHALGSHDCGQDGEAAEPSKPPTIEEAAERIGFEVSDVSEGITKLAGDLSDGLGDLSTALEENGGELARLTNAVERLGDILDKRLS